MVFSSSGGGEKERSCRVELRGVWGGGGGVGGGVGGGGGGGLILEERVG